MLQKSVIIMINGSFGVGKTSVATCLCEQIPGAIFLDPELIGTYARTVTEGIRSGAEDTDDYQDIELWRTLTVTTGQALYRRYHRPVVVPMTFSNRDYLEMVRTGWEAVVPVAHFCLTAPWSVIQQRLLQRGDGPNSWAWRNAERCVPLFNDPYYAEHIPTEGYAASEVADAIRAKLPPTVSGTTEHRFL